MRSARGDTISPIALAPPRDGARLQLSLDTEIQAEAERLVQRAMIENDAQSVVAISLDPRTGGVLAMASAPGTQDRAYGDSLPEELRLRAIADQYEPGSTFKTVTVAAGLDRKVITPDTLFAVNECIRIYDRRICDAESHGPEQLTVADILRVSSNVGAVQIAYKKLSGPNDDDRGQFFAPYIERFGFGRKTGIDLPGEVAGQVPDYHQWSGTTIGNIPFGQGLASTPIQLTAFYAMIANDGVWIQPHVVDRVGADLVRPRTVRMLPRRVTRQLASMLQGVVGVNGTGERAAIPGYSVAGKTGTTQKVINGRYSKKHYVGFFVGFAPARHPRVVTLVLVDDAGAGKPYAGGETAAPVFAQLTAKALQVLGVKKGK